MHARPAPPVSDFIKAFVYDRAAHRCEYCLLTAVLLHPDHITPWSLWDRDPLEYSQPDNLASACYQCNGMKQDHVDGLDPLTGDAAPLFNPRSDVWSDHFAWTDDFLEIVPITMVGRVTMARLRMNRPWYKAQRLLLRRAWLGGHDPWP